MVTFSIPINEDLDLENTEKYADFLSARFSTLQCPIHPTANSEISVKRLGDVFLCAPLSVCCDGFYVSLVERADHVANMILESGQ